MIASILALLFVSISSCSGYTAVGRFGHSAVLVNDSIYFYGGDTSITSSTSTPLWISDMAILPINVPFPLTDPPWKPASGPQNSVGGPVVYSHTAFVGGPNGGNMIIIGGVMPTTENSNSDDESTAYSYDCDVGRWNSFSLPTQNYLNRQGAASSVTSNGIAHIWGGKRATVSGGTPSTSTSSTAKPRLPATMYQVDSLYPSNSTMAPTSSPLPSLRYGHTQTLINDRTVVILGGFDSLTGDAVSLGDVWLYDIPSSTWTHKFANLDKDNKPANRSSHSQVLMRDGVSILIYGGYDGYHVYNDVAVLDTRTWSWTIKNTNAAVQGRADHTATLVGTNMVVAFGFTGVSTALTVMSDIEVLDTITWSWTSFYTPSNGYGDGGNPTNGIGDQGKTVAVMPSTPSMAIVAGAVTGVLVVLVLIIVALYMFNYHQQRHKHNQGEMIQDQRSSRRRRRRQRPYWGPRSGFDNDDPFATQSDLDSPITKDALPQLSPQERSYLGRAPTRLQIATNPEITNYAPPGQQQQQHQQPHLPSPWTPITRQSFPPASSEWMVRRAATTPHHFHRPYISKPDEPFASIPKQYNIRRAATTPRAVATFGATTSGSGSGAVADVSAADTSGTTGSKQDTTEDDDSLFDQQEFVLRSADDDFPPFPHEKNTDQHSHSDDQESIRIVDGSSSSSSTSNRNMRPPPPFLTFRSSSFERPTSSSSLQQLQQSRLFLSTPSLNNRESQAAHDWIMFFQRHSS